MPAALRSRASLAAAAGLLSISLAACAADGGGDVAEDVEADVHVRGTDALKFEPTEIEAEAGTISIALTSEGGLPHDVVIEEADDAEVVAARGGTNVGTIDLEAGTYTFYCSVPGHRTAGMEGTLTVD